MPVTLDLVLDCPPDAAWEAVHAPAVFRAVSGPWTTVESLEQGGFPAPGGRTLFRDRLDVGAGILTPVVMVGFWVFWQLRARQIKRLAPGWRTQFASRP